MLEKYRPSGRTNAFAFALVPFLFVVAAALAWAYQWLIEVIPFIYLDALLVIGFGAGVGYGTFLAMKAGKCRNRAIGAVSGALAGLVAVGASHYFAYQHAVGNQQGVSIGQYLDFRTQNGWKLGRHGSGMPITGFFVYLVWGVEALAIVIAGAIGGTEATGRPFCEPCAAWADKIVALKTIRTPGAAAVEGLKRADSITTLLDLPPAGPDAGGPLGKDELTYTIKGCPTCGGTTTLSVAFRSFFLKGKKKEESKNETLHAHLLLSPEEVGTVKELVEGMTLTGGASR